jgi:class 3 adenylate cyclase
MSTEVQQLQAAVAGLEAQRALLGDAVAEAALAPLRARLAALSAAAAPAQSLRQVTILFLDVVGSTPLSQRLDPEAIQAVMDGALTRCTAIVESRRGKVLQYAGDSLLAVFGADEVREDDPERAVRCGLDLLAEGLALSEQVQRTHQYTGFNVRVGLHTGGVLLGGGVDAEGSIRGIAVNIAARMEQTAPAGGLRISHDTYRHVRGVFDVEAQPPLAVKGVAEPISTYLVLRAKARAFRVATRGVEGVETRMIGRDAELEQLQQAFKRVVREGRLVRVAVVAEAGLGKSRLLYEFENWAEARPEAFCIFQGRANPQTQSQPYGLLRDMLSWRLQIADSDTMAVARRKLEDGIVPLFEAGADGGSDMAQAHAHVLGHLIGLDFGQSRHIGGIKDDVQQIRNRGFHAAAQLLRRYAAVHAAPVVLLLDDLHFADDASLDFLNYVCAVNRDVPLLVLTLTRPTLFERRGAGEVEGALGPHDSRINLAPLDKGVSRLLVNELLKRLDEVPSALRDLISGGAEGNPFYMEELVKMLIDEGAIEVGADRWSVVPARLVATHVPLTLTGVLQARIDSLRPAEKLALQQASVVGFVFWDEALAAIDDRSPGELPNLTRRDLVVSQAQADLEGLREFAFRHHILHHVTYDTVLKRLRREGHARVAAWLARRSGARPATLLGETAQHYERAGDVPRACEFYLRAAEHARDRYAHEAALAYVERALALLDEASGRAANDAAHEPLRLRWGLLEVRERILDLRGKRDAQHADIEAMEQLAQVLDDARCRGFAAFRRSTLAMHTGNYCAQEVSAREAIEFASRADDLTLRLRAQLSLALALNYLGDAAGARSLAHACVAESRRLGLRAIESHFLNALSIVASLQEDTLLAIDLGRQQLAIDRELGNPRDEAITLGNLGCSLLTFGQNDESSRCAHEGLRLARAVGDREGQFVPLHTLSVLALRGGNDAQALAHAQAALELAIEVTNPPLELLALIALGQAELALGRHAAAAAALEDAHAKALALEQRGLVYAAAMWHEAGAGLAQVALAQGDLARAREHVEALLPHLAEGGAVLSAESPFQVMLTCYRVLTRARDARAAPLLGVAYRMLQAKAASLPDAGMRADFLTNIPENGDIAAAWRACQAMAEPAP